MRTLNEIEQLMVAGGADSGSVICPTDADGMSSCPAVVVAGPSTNGNASPSLSDAMWGGAGGAAIGYGLTIVADGFLVGAGIAVGFASAPLWVGPAIGVAVTLAGAALAQAIANANNGQSTATIGQSSWGQVSQP